MYLTIITLTSKDTIPDDYTNMMDLVNGIYNGEIDSFEMKSYDNNKVCGCKYIPTVIDHRCKDHSSGPAPINWGDDE